MLRDYIQKERATKYLFEGQGHTAEKPLRYYTLVIKSILKQRYPSNNQKKITVPSLETFIRYSSPREEETDH